MCVRKTLSAVFKIISWGLTEKLQQQKTADWWNFTLSVKKKDVPTFHSHIQAFPTLISLTITERQTCRGLLSDRGKSCVPLHSEIESIVGRVVWLWLFQDFIWNLHSVIAPVFNLHVCDSVWIEKKEKNQKSIGVTEDIWRCDHCKTQDEGWKHSLTINKQSQSRWDYCAVLHKYYFIQSEWNVYVYSACPHS